MIRSRRQQPLIHRRALLMLVLLGLACTLPFVTSADTSDLPSSSSVPALSPSAEPQPTTEQTGEPTTEPTAPATPTAQPTESAGPSAGGLPYIVTFGRNVSTDAAAAIVGGVGGTMDAMVPELRMAMIRLPNTAAAAALGADPGVARLEDDTTRAAEAVPSDGLFGNQWALRQIGWTDVYGAVDPSAATIVAILDTGVSADHPDLAQKLIAGTSFVDGVAADTDPNGHGTWMAGIVGAATDNGVGRCRRGLGRCAHPSDHGARRSWSGPGQRGHPGPGRKRLIRAPTSS